MVASWSLAVAMAVLALVMLQATAVAGVVAAICLFFGAYVANGQRSIASAIGFPVGLLLVVVFEPLFPVSELGGKYIGLAAYAGLIGLIGSTVANIVDRRSPLRTVIDAVAYSAVFGIAFLSLLYGGYMLLVVCQLFLPHGLFFATVGSVLSICAAGGLAGALVGMCSWITGQPKEAFYPLPLQ
jgi:hypothetical protein